MDRRGWLNFIGRRVLPAVAVLALLAASLPLQVQARTRFWVSLVGRENRA